MKLTQLLSALLVLSAAAHSQTPAPSPVRDTEPNAGMQLWIDLDGDGDTDLYSIAPGRTDVALRNLGPRTPGEFQDATLELGLSGNQSRLAHFRDLDGDGRPELLLVPYCCGLNLFRRGADGSFAEATAGSGLSFGKTVVSLELVDVDRDSRVDLALGTLDGSPMVLCNLGGLAFERVELNLPSGVIAATRATEVLMGAATATLAESPNPDATAAEPRLPDAADGRSSDDRGRIVPTRTDGAKPDNGLGSHNLVTPGQQLSAGSHLPVEVNRALTHPHLACAPTIRDQAGVGTCLKASTLPMLGMLYPISSDWFVDSAGNVGLGTTTPTVRLEVDGQSQFQGSDSQSAVTAIGHLGPTNGYLGVQGTTDFDGIASVDWPGREIGVAGISTGSSTVDNYGVRGHSNGVGVRGEHSTAWTLDYGELGLAGIGLRASGTLLAADLLGDVEIDGSVKADTGGVGAAGKFIGDVDVTGTVRATSSGVALAGDFDGDVETLGAIRVKSTTLIDTFDITGGSSAGGVMVGRNGAGNSTFTLDTDTSGSGTQRLANSSGVTKILLDGGASDGGGDLTMYATDGSVTLFVDANESTSDAAVISLRNDTSEETIALRGDNSVDSGGISLYDRLGGNNIEGIRMNARGASSPGAEFVMRNSAGLQAVDIDTEVSFTGLVTPVMRFYEGDGSIMFGLSNNSMKLYNSAGVSTILYDRQSGLKSCVVETEDQGERLLYVMESPEVWFEDFGRGQLSGGSARIDLDPLYLETTVINSSHPSEVFVSLTAPARGVWIEKGDTYFIVHELDGGKSHATFDWRIVAKRKGVEDRRFERLVPDAVQAEDNPLAGRAAVDSPDGEPSE